ncbi:MFS general substrate transporter [Marasmius fiardii PR-910]|nr:MFS general substrate transporter [Marasmius fiardii PR-910]
MDPTKNYKRKLHGWLSYAFASEVFVIVSLTLFLPICLEQFARDNGYLQSDRATKCIDSVNVDEAVPDGGPGERCVVKIGWFWIDSASFSLYVYSMSVALQALTVISVGGIADHPHHRKRLLLGFALSGAFSAVLFLALPSSSPVWFLSSCLAIIANVGFGVSVVAMNAYLPSLAKASPTVAQILGEIQEAESNDERVESGARVDDTNEEPDSEQPLIQRLPLDKVTKLRSQYETELSRATSRISSMGVALGYAAGICLLLVALVPVTKLKGTTFALRLAIALSGVWWAVFSIPAALWLPGAGTPTENADAVWVDDEDLQEGEWSIWRELLAAWKRLGGMLRWSEIKKLRDTFKYLAAWFLISDGFTTISSTAILFGKTVLNMQPSSLILIGVITPMSGILGSLAWPKMQSYFEWSNQRVIVMLLALASLVPAYGCLGFLSIFHDHFGGLTSQNEMFGLAVYFGFMYGAFQGYARAFYAELIPPGEEARWYALYSITDKSSSFVGPLIVGLISDLTGNIRYGFFFLIFMIWMSIPIMLTVNVEKGRKDAQSYSYSSSNTP